MSWHGSDPAAMGSSGAAGTAPSTIVVVPVDSGAPAMMNGDGASGAPMVMGGPRARGVPGYILNQQPLANGDGASGAPQAWGSDRWRNRDR